MIKKYLTLFCLIVVSQISISQIVQLTISDSLNEPIFGAAVFNNSVLKGNYYGNVITIKGVAKDTLLIQAYFYNDVRIILKSAQFENDTAQINVTLSPKDRMLGEVIITSEDSTVFYDVHNSNVIDYYPFDKLCFYALKERDGRYLQLNNGSKVLKKVKLDFNPTEFYLDVFGNFHLLSADSAYQFWTNESQLIWMDPIPIDTFNQQVRPLIGTSSTSVYTQAYEQINKFYKVKQVQKDSVKICYTSFDVQEFKTARSQEYKIIGMYYATVPIVSNVIENGIWDGDFVKLAENNALVQEIGWYRAALDNPINCEAHGTKDYIAVIDFFRDSVALIDYNSGERIKDSKLENPTKGYCSTFYDYFFDVIYIIDQTGNGINIYELNPLTGTTKKLKGIHGIPFVENVKISGNWVYFEIRERTGYNKILRLPIR